MQEDASLQQRVTWGVYAAGPRLRRVPMPLFETRLAVNSGHRGIPRCLVVICIWACFNDIKKLAAQRSRNSEEDLVQLSRNESCLYPANPTRV